MEALCTCCELIYLKNFVQRVEFHRYQNKDDLIRTILLPSTLNYFRTEYFLLGDEIVPFIKYV